MIDDRQLETLLAPDVQLREVEPQIYSVYPPDTESQFYDDKAGFYDRVIGNPLYNRIMWGYSIKEFGAFCDAALNSSSESWVLDAGCGSLVFTAGSYAAYSARPVLLLDRSVGMLVAAKARLREAAGRLPENGLFLQGDILALPFRPNSFQTVISMNVLHILEDARGVLSELNRVRADGGSISASSLVRGRRWGSGYLALLHKSGGIATPRAAAELLDFCADLDIAMDGRVAGNMAFFRTPLAAG